MCLHKASYVWISFPPPSPPLFFLVQGLVFQCIKMALYEVCVNQYSFIQHIW